MIAQHHGDIVAHVVEKAQCAQGVGATIDQVPSYPEAILLGVKGDFLQQTLQSAQTALYIAYGIGCHEW